MVLSFNATEVTLQDKSNAKIPAIKWTRDKARVDLAIDSDTVALSLDGKPAGTLSIPGIAKLKGTITFRARQCACALDNVVLRSQE